MRQAFDLYASGTYTLRTLREEMHRRGLRGRSGKPLVLEALSVMLRNPFYCGLIRIKRTGQTFEGVHKPIITKATFDRVQAVMTGRVFARPQKHVHLFRRMIRCAECGYSLIGETRKGHIYYRCHTPSCRGTTLREPDIDRAVRERLAQLHFEENEMESLLSGADTRGALLLCGALFFIGITMAIIGISAIHRGRDYYQATIFKKTVLEHALDLRQGVAGLSSPKATLAIATTSGMQDVQKILDGRPPTPFWKRVFRNRVISYFMWFLTLLAIINIAGIAYVASRIPEIAAAEDPQPSGVTNVTVQF